MPRPTRRFALLLPAAGFIVLRRIACSKISLALYPHEVADLVDHAANGLGVGQFDRVADPPQPQSANGRAVVVTAGVRPLDERHLDLLAAVRHDVYASSISSTVLPRFAATSAGALTASSALIVARTTLYGLVDPWHLARMFVTPTTSNTARIAPPAMTPVPSEAGCMCTRVDPCRPSTA